jgi:hypothetical protein
MTLKRRGDPRDLSSDIESLLEEHDLEICGECRGSGYLVPEKVDPADPLRNDCKKCERRGYVHKPTRRIGRVEIDFDLTESGRAMSVKVDGKRLRNVTSFNLSWDANRGGPAIFEARMICTAGALELDEAGVDYETKIIDLNPPGRAPR